MNKEIRYDDGEVFGIVGRAVGRDGKEFAGGSHEGASKLNEISNTKLRANRLFYVHGIYLFIPWKCHLYGYNEALNLYKYNLTCNYIGILLA